MNIVCERGWDEFEFRRVRNNEFEVRKGDFYDNEASLSLYIDDVFLKKIYFYKRESAASFVGSWANYSEDCYEDIDISFSTDGPHNIQLKLMEDDMGEVAVGAMALYDISNGVTFVERKEAIDLAPSAFTGTARLHPATKRTVIDMHVHDLKAIRSSVSFPFSPVKKGRYRLRIYYYSRKRKSLYEIFYLIEGVGKYIIDGTEYHLRPGCMVLSSPNEIRRLVLSKSHASEYISIEFGVNLFYSLDSSGWLLQAFNCQRERKNNFYEPQIISSELSTQIKRVTDIPPLDLSIQQIGLKMKLQMILYQINLLYISKEQYKEESISLDLVDQVMQYINTYLYEDINIDVLADKFSINKTSLNYFFRKKNGYTIHHYITLKRLLSVQLLVQQGKSVVDAAMSVGFQDYSTFYRQYKKHFGHSPKDEKTRKNL